MPSELEDSPYLADKHLVNLLCILAVRLERIETLMGDLLNELGEQAEFQNYQILKTRMDNMRLDNKTPRQRLNDLENQFTGMVSFFNNKLSEVKSYKPKRQFKYS